MIDETATMTDFPVLPAEADAPVVGRARRLRRFAGEIDGDALSPLTAALRRRAAELEFIAAVAANRAPAFRPVAADAAA